MDDTQVRLANCFLNLFPSMTAQEIQTASPTTVTGWDSLTSLTLLTLVGEEFNIEMDFEALLEGLSYQRILEYLQHKAAVR
jgi:acyl carrier protein